jgi:hypothetical protein
MMSDPAERIELTNPQEYQRKLREKLQGRDPLDVLSETPEVLSSIVDSSSVTELQTRPFPGKWTPNEILGHLVDAEWAFGYRIRTVLCDERPSIFGFDQENWVAVQKHNERDPAELLETFITLRRLNLRIWRQMSAEQRGRVGLHVERGEESLETMLHLEAGHDLSHLDQIQRYLAAIRG